MTLSPRIFALIMALGLLPWFVMQWHTSLNGDITWLILAAERLLDGQSMLQSYYEVNPPLSILYNIPPVLIGKILPVPDQYVIFFYFLALIAVAAFAMNEIAKRWDFIDRDVRYILIAAFVIPNTIIATVSIGERDQIVLLGLLPFLMAQLSMTWGYKLPGKLFWPVMVFGVIAVLIKPHFGLLPTLLLAHRAVAQKRLFSIMRDPDFLSLAIGTLSYIAIVWFFFRDYVDVIMPDVIALYASNKHYEYAVPQLLWHSYLFITFLGVEAAFSPLEGRKKRLLVLFYAGALAALVPFAVQMKAFYYHLIPAIVFFFCGFGLSLHSYADVYLKRLRFIGAGVVFALFVMAYINRPLLLEFPKHDDYKTFPLTQEIAKCEEPCPVFMFNDSIEVMHPTFFYMGRENASRFPTLWFLPKLVEHPDSPEAMPYRAKYAEMVGEDLKNYQPKMLLIGQYWVEDNVKMFDFAEFFSVSPLFKEEWAHYKKDRRIIVNRKPYFAGTELGEDFPMTYDIYLRSL